MTVERPLVALLGSRGTTGRLVPLLGVVGRWVDIVSWHALDGRRPDAVVLTSFDRLDRLAGSPAADLPIATWVDHHDEVDRARAAGVVALLTAEPALAGREAIVVPAIGIEADRWPPVAPLVRARWRQQLGLDPHHVAVVEGHVDPGDGERELMVAAACVVSGPATLLALAMGAPVVTSSETAGRLGLRRGRDVEVAAGRTEAVAVAHDVARDPARAAELSRRGRRCVERHHDLGRPAAELARRFGWHVPDALEHRFAELATPGSAPVRLRADAALAVLRGHGQGSRS